MSQAENTGQLKQEYLNTDEIPSSNIDKTQEELAAVELKEVYYSSGKDPDTSLEFLIGINPETNMTDVPNFGETVQISDVPNYTTVETERPIFITQTDTPLGDEVMFGKIDPETGEVQEMLTATEYADQRATEIHSNPDDEYAEQMAAFLGVEDENDPTVEVGMETEQVGSTVESATAEGDGEFYTVNEYSALRARVASGELKFSKNANGMLQVEDLNGQVVREIAPNESYQYNFQKASIAGESNRASLEAMSPGEQEHAILESRLKSGEFRIIPASRNEEGRVTELKVINSLTNEDVKSRLSRDELSDGSLMRAQAEYDSNLRQYEAENLKIEDAPEGAVESDISSEDGTSVTQTQETTSNASVEKSEQPVSKAQEIISSTESIKNFESLSLEEQLALMNQFKELVQLLLDQAESNEDKVQQMLLKAIMGQVEAQISQIEQRIKEQNEAKSEAEQISEIEAKVETPMQKYSEQLKNLGNMPIEQQIGFLSEVMGDFFEASKNTESSVAQKARSELFTIMMEIFKSLFNIETEGKKTAEKNPEASTAPSEDSPEASVGTEDTSSAPVQPVSAGVYVDTETNKPLTQDEVESSDNMEVAANESEPITLSPELEAFHTAVTGGEASNDQNEAESIVNSVFDNETQEDPLEAYQQASTYDVESSSS